MSVVEATVAAACLLVDFKPLDPATLDRLIAKGVEDAKALDRAIRDQFTLGPEADLRLR
jgi:hypothetical protein